MKNAGIHESWHTNKVIVYPVIIVRVSSLNVTRYVRETVIVYVNDLSFFATKEALKLTTLDEKLFMEAFYEIGCRNEKRPFGHVKNKGYSNVWKRCKLWRFTHSYCWIERGAVLCSKKDLRKKLGMTH